MGRIGMPTGGTMRGDCGAATSAKSARRTSRRQPDRASRGQVGKKNRRFFVKSQSLLSLVAISLLFAEKGVRQQ